MRCLVVVVGVVVGAVVGVCACACDCIGVGAGDGDGVVVGIGVGAGAGAVCSVLCALCSVLSALLRSSGRGERKGRWVEDGEWRTRVRRHSNEISPKTLVFTPKHPEAAFPRN